MLRQIIIIFSTLHLYYCQPANNWYLPPSSSSTDNWPIFFPFMFSTHHFPYLPSWVLEPPHKPWPSTNTTNATTTTVSPTTTSTTTPRPENVTTLAPEPSTVDRSVLTVNPSNGTRNGALMAATDVLSQLNMAANNVYMIILRSRKNRTDSPDINTSNPIKSEAINGSYTYQSADGFTYTVIFMGNRQTNSTSSKTGMDTNENTTPVPISLPTVPQFLTNSLKFLQKNRTNTPSESQSKIPESEVNPREKRGAKLGMLNNNLGFYNQFDSRRRGRNVQRNLLTRMLQTNTQNSEIVTPDDVPITAPNGNVFIITPRRGLGLRRGLRMVQMMSPIQPTSNPTT